MALRFVPTGNIEAAGRLKGVGLRLLYDLKRRMSFQKLFQDRTVLRADDGIIIECLVCGALDTINVFVPIEIVAEEKAVITEIGELKYRIYCVLIEHGWWKNGDVIGYVLPNEAYKQVYLKVDINGVVSELQEGEMQDFVVKTPLSEFRLRERIVNNVSIEEIKPWGYTTDSDGCSKKKSYSSYLYTPNLPKAIWCYLLKMPDGRTLGIMGHNTGIAAWNAESTIIKYKAALQRTIYEQIEHTFLGSTSTFITVWYEGISEIFGASYKGIPYWEKDGVWTASPYPGMYKDGWEFKGRQYNKDDPESFDYWDSSGLTKSELESLIITRTETYTKPSVTLYSCTAENFKDQQPNIENPFEVSTFLNFENAYRVFDSQKYIIDNYEGYYWNNSLEGLILTSDNTIIIKLSKPENNYARIEYGAEGIELEVIEGEIPELPNIIYSSISGIKEYSPIIADLYSCAESDEVIINQYFKKMGYRAPESLAFPLLPKTGFANYNTVEESLFLSTGGR